MALVNPSYKAPKGKKVRGIHISAGNRKVRFPILSVGSGTDCASKRWCPFSLEQYKQSGRKQCYVEH
jgi:hypothetical protein